MLLQLSWFFPFAPLHPAHPIPSGNPHTIVHVRGSYIGSLVTPFPILHFTSPWLFCDYQFAYLYFLIPSPLHPFLHNRLLPGNHRNALLIHDSVSVLVYLVCFLDSIVDRYVFIAILLFIVLILFFLKKVPLTVHS